MFTQEHVASIQSAMDEEHRKDREALQRLMRLAGIAGVELDQVQVQGQAQSEVGPVQQAATTAIDAIKEIMRSTPSRTWSAQALVPELKKRGVKLSSENPVQSVSSTLKKLRDRNVIGLQMKGSGREPNAYQWSGIKTSTKKEVEDVFVTE